MRLAILLSLSLTLSAAAFAAAWYEGGTLQKATVADWQTGAAENKLATAGDFIASITAVADIADIKDPKAAAGIKKRSEELVTCVDTMAETADMPSDTPVAQLVVRCALLPEK
jgi:hypothetical protein